MTLIFRTLAVREQTKLYQLIVSPIVQEGFIEERKKERKRKE